MIGGVPGAAAGDAMKRRSARLKCMSTGRAARRRHRCLALRAVTIGAQRCATRDRTGCNAGCAPQVDRHGAADRRASWRRAADGVAFAGTRRTRCARQGESKVMDQAIWLAIVAVLALALMFARRAARARRKRLADGARAGAPQATQVQAAPDVGSHRDARLRRSEHARRYDHARQRPQHDAEPAGDDCAGIASPRWFGGATQAVRQAGLEPPYWQTVPGGRKTWRVIVLVCACP